jgi:hypothetical protein
MSSHDNPTRQIQQGIIIEENRVFGNVGHILKLIQIQTTPKKQTNKKWHGRKRGACRRVMGVHLGNWVIGQRCVVCTIEGRSMVLTAGEDGTFLASKRGCSTPGGTLGNAVWKALL